MTYSKKDLNQLFERWGKKSATFPAQNEVLKTKILSQQSLENSSILKKYPTFSFRWLALAGVVVLVLLFTNKNTLDNILTSYPQSSGRDEPYAINEKSSLKHSGQLNPTDLGIDQPRATGFPSREPVDIVNDLTKLVTEPIRRMMPNSSPIADTREFLKTSYGAEIKTGQVKKLSTQITTMIRGYGGRVDNVSVDPEYGGINFVLPKNALASFRNELTGLVPDRFISENERSNNLLSTKQNIEFGQSVNQTELSALQTQRINELKKHNGIIAGLRNNFADLSRRIAELDKQIGDAKDVNSREYFNLAASQKELLDQRTKTNNRIAVENNRYTNEISTIDSQIKNTKDSLQQLAEQNKNFLNDVETIDASIYLEHISVLEVIELYVPSYVLWPLAIALIVLAYYARRRKITNLP
jgi:hypothetical protein